MDASAIDLAKILPSFMASQADDVAFADALSAVIRLRAKRCEQIGVWDAISGMDEDILDYAAQALGIAWWRGDWSLAEKREMLGMAEQIRCGVNSHWALETLLKKWFGDSTLRVEEWFDYGGQPYTFRILTSSADVQRQLRFSRIMETVQRTSQSMDGIFVGFSMRGRVFLGAKGSDSRTERGEAVSYAYIPKGATWARDGAAWDALGAIIKATSPQIYDENDPIENADPNDDGVFESDLCLGYSDTDGEVAAPATHDRKERLDAAVARWWSAIGVEQDAPSIAYAWPPPHPAPAADLLTGLTHHWALGKSEMSYASSVEGDTKTIGGFAGDASWSASGRIGGCVAGTAISGSNYTNSDWPGYPFGPNRTLSLSLWLRMDSASSDKHECGFTIGRLDASGTAWVGFSADRKPCVFRGGPFEIVKGTTALSVGWHHFVLVGNAGTLTCYCDGSVFGTTTLTNQSAYSSAEFKFGRGGVSPSGCVGLSGAVDEISVWLTRAIGQAEVTALYNGGNGLPFEDWT